MLLAGFREGFCDLLLLNCVLYEGSQVGFGERVCAIVAVYGLGEGC